MALFVSGVAKGKDGSGLAGVTIKISSASLPGARTTITQPDGSFQFSDIPEGQYELHATGAGISIGSITMNEPFNPALRDAVERISAKLDRLKAMSEESNREVMDEIKKTGEQFQAGVDELHVSLDRYDAIQKAATAQLEDDARDQIVDGLDDTQSHAQKPASGLTRLLGFIGSFVLGWKLAGKK